MNYWNTWSEKMKRPVQKLGDISEKVKQNMQVDYSYDVSESR